MKEEWFKSTGVLRYGSKKLPHSSRLPTTNKWWAVVDCCDDLLRYYKQFAEKGYGIKLLPVTWGSHISLVLGDEPPNKSAWNEGNDKPINFYYSNQIGSNGSYYWLPVKSQELVQIRTNLGLSPKPMFDFHLTIGKKSEDIYYPDKYMREIR